MSTIALREGVLAADRQVSANGTKAGRTCKLAVIDLGEHGKHALGGTGDLSSVAAFIDWYQRADGGRNRDAVPDIEDFEVLAVDGGGKVWHWDCGFFPVEIEAPYHAIGSGRDVAFGAMGAGATAEDAVAIAARHDIYTGGGVDRVFVGEAAVERCR